MNEGTDEPIRTPGTVSGPLARSRRIIDLFRQERVDPSAEEILAVAILHEREIARFAPAEMFPDPSRDTAEGSDQQAATLARLILPSYQPGFLPASARLTSRTRCMERTFGPNESLEPRQVNQTLAGILARLLDDDEVAKCSAISLSGDSPALGPTRFAVAVRSGTGAES